MLNALFASNALFLLNCLEEDQMISVTVWRYRACSSEESIFLKIFVSLKEAGWFLSCKEIEECLNN